MITISEFRRYTDDFTCWEWFRAKKERISKPYLSYNTDADAHVLCGDTEKYGTRMFWMYDVEYPTGEMLDQNNLTYRPYEFRYVITIDGKRYTPPKIRRHWAEVSAILDHNRMEETLEELEDIDHGHDWRNDG